MHSNSHTAVRLDLREAADLDLPELEALRTKLGLKQAEICRKLEISPSTYQRWLRHIKGLPGGVCPQPRSLNALRAAVLREAARRDVLPAA
ncbi:MAG: helix-turn-helix domain-containing protein [Burkholderiaceae bacterium]